MYPLTNTSVFTSCLRVTTPFTKPKAVLVGKKKQQTLVAQKSMAARSEIWM